MGDDNVFVFGKTAEEVENAVRAGYNSLDPFRQDRSSRHAVEMVRDGFFSSGDRTAFQPLLELIFRDGDRYLVMAVFTAYATSQQRVAKAFLDRKE